MTLLRPGRSSAATRKRGRVADLRARLAARPDSEHEQAVIRIVIVSLLLGPFVLLATLLEEPHGFGQGALLAAVYLVLSLGYLGWIVFEPGISRLRRVLGMVTDHTALSLVVLYGGPWVGALYPIYLWITFGNGFRFGNQYLGAAAGYSFVAFSAAAWLNPFWHDNLALTTGLALGLVVLPGYVASLIRKLTEAKRTAEAANRAKSRFLATMSHELRTPLNAVIGLSDLLGATKLDREQADMVSTVGSSGRALLALINDILDLAKIEAGKAEVQADDFELVAELASTASILRPQAHRKGLELGLLVDADVPARANGDVRHLRQVLLNLLSNAVKFTERGGVTLRVEADPRRDGHWLKLHVEDSGIGIGEADRKHIFDAFTQSEDDANRRHGGTGLGLAIARQLAEAMSGTLSVSSLPGHGSTFTLSLPLAAAATPAPAADGGPSDVRLVAPGQVAAADLGRTLQDAGARLHRGDSRSGAEVLCVDLRGVQDEAQSALDERLLDKLTTAASQARGALVVTERNGQVPRALAFALASAVRIGVPADPQTLQRALHLVARLGTTGHEQSALAEELAAPRQRRTATVLVVEDNPVNRKVTAKILERGGHTAVLSASGEEALDRLEDGGIDAVLMDVNMPGESGIDTVKLFRFTQMGGGEHLPILALTADATVETRDACLAAGMDDFITKPVDAVNLLRTLDRHLPAAESAAGQAEAAAQARPSGGDSADAPVVDASSVGTLRDLDPTGIFLGEVVADFLADTDMLLAEIADGISAGDDVRVADLLHALKSSAGNVGAARLRARAIELERQVRAGGCAAGRHAVGLLRQDADAYHRTIAPELPDEPPRAGAAGGDASNVIPMPGPSARRP